MGGGMGMQQPMMNNQFQNPMGNAQMGAKPGMKKVGAAGAKGPKINESCMRDPYTGEQVCV